MSEWHDIYMSCHTMWHYWHTIDTQYWHTIDTSYYWHTILLTLNIDSFDSILLSIDSILLTYYTIDTQYSQYWHTIDTQYIDTLLPLNHASIMCAFIHMCAARSCVPWLLYMCVMPYMALDHVWHASIIVTHMVLKYRSLIGQKRPIFLRILAPYVWHGSVWLRHVHQSFVRHGEMCDMPQSHRAMAHSCHTEPWLIRMCAVTPSYACHKPFICVPWLIHTCATTHSDVCHDSFICVPWLVHSLSPVWYPITLLIYPQ